MCEGSSSRALPLRWQLAGLLWLVVALRTARRLQKRKLMREPK